MNAAPRRLVRTAVAAVAAAATTVGAFAATPAFADDAVTPADGSVTIDGAGWGHGKGLSQWGAYGAASQGLSYAEIINFYYDGTTLGSLPSNYVVKVWISADDDNILHFRPARGQIVKDSAGKKVKLPYGSDYTKWRIKRTANGRVLQYRDAGGKYRSYAVKLNAKRVWYVSNTKTGKVKLALGGATKTYRGKLAALYQGSGMLTVNYLQMEDYLRSVVPSEMPGYWPVEALKAQAVAARTYAAKQKQASTKVYDLCDTSACQVYKGTATEYSATDVAVAGSAQQVVKYNDELALTMFSASNGGWAASGGTEYPYLAAHEDPYDGVKRDQSWTVTLSAAKIEKAYPEIGTLQTIQVTQRDGNGTWGGRVDLVELVGSLGTVQVTGGSFKSKFSLRERLFNITAG